ncbi:MmgE/PrpD family protein [Novosphingobium sp. SG707]|uniref:MmgE/PrpD family protein n=1 Tax=Novosphingobium sp. SG707 TaxID=2586996 RepID=UPI0014475399|nr:MmgE/PrpD family protein [Novosphingobium sp. SG707]NKJ00971.1 2-methylcitrate dehydratase PrpD [Novosphingobium sp. SG707]
MTTPPPQALQLPTDPEGPTGKLCLWLAGLQLADVPEPVIERAKDLLLDGIACALVGAQLPWSRVATQAVFGFEGAGDGIVIGWGRTIGRPAAALLNGTFIQGFELDDVHYRGPLHSASLVIPAILAVAAGQPVSGADALVAAIAGFETGPRVGMALHGLQMLSRGWHSGAVFGTHAAAATAGRLLGLAPDAMEDAIGLAGTQSAGLMAAQFEAMSKRMHHGFSARAGYSAAMLASAGYTGIKRVYERDYGGFLAMFGEGHNPDATKITEGLGMQWETSHISIKRYAAMGALHGPLDAVFELRARRPFRPEEIQSVSIGMSHASFHHGWWEAERPLTPIGAQMHVGYAVAAAILDGAAMARQFSPARIDSADIWALMPRIRAYHEPAFDTDFAARLNSVMTVRFADGSEEVVRIATPKTVGEPLQRSGVIDKYNALTDGIISHDRRDSIRQMVLALETLPSLTPLIDALAAPVGCTFDL